MAGSLEGLKAYQSSGVGAVNTEQGNGRADFLGRGGIGAQTHEGRARRGELLGGTQAGAGDTSGHHRGIECEGASGWEVTRELRWGRMRAAVGCIVKVEMEVRLLPGSRAAG